VARTLSPVRAVAVVALAACLLALAAGSARADGDPASDVLYFQGVFLPYGNPPPASGPDLTAAVAEANKAGYRMKVAVIAAPVDLGLVASLIGKPQVYARFLGAEIRSFFTGHLLVVMQQGFGIWYDRFDVRSQQTLLREVKIENGDADGLTRAAAAAVRLLAARDTSKPTVRDPNPPIPKAFPAYATRGRTAHLDYSVFDDSGRSREEVRVYGAKLALLAILTDPMSPARGGPHRVTWRVPKTIRARLLKFCVVAVDPAGNQSKASCAPLHLR
jgi:hypothetical protein